MITWEYLQSILIEYQSFKGSFRKIFHTNSDFINFLSQLCKGRLPDSSLDLKEQFLLLEQILAISTSDQRTLSYQCATKIVDKYVTQDRAIVFSLFQLLYSLKLFRFPVFQAIEQHENPNVVAQALMTAISSFSSKTHDLLFRYFSLFFSHQLTLECCLGHLFSCVQNKEEACSWYCKSIEILGQNCILPIALEFHHQ